MKTMTMVLVAGALLAGCRSAMSPEVVQQYQGRTLYTCCNIHHETDAVSDANYYVGALVPAGASATVRGSARNGLAITADGTSLTLSHDYGTKEESFQQYVDKILVASDPKTRIASFSRPVQDAIHEARVERNMTREQVLLSIGYPPTHRTPSLNDREWTYWYNRWITYKVVFNDAGVVADIVGRPAPTRDQPIVEPKAAPPSARPAAKKKRH